LTAGERILFALLPTTTVLYSKLSTSRFTTGRVKKLKNDKLSGIVFSTEHGRMCPACGRPAAQCVCRRQSATSFQGNGIVRIGRETKGRKGKGVTVITGVGLDEAGLKELATALKQKCGAGGTVKDGVIEIQGDHRDRLVEELQKKGFTVKRCGG
jgi:translation initiation factor 1